MFIQNLADSVEESDVSMLFGRCQIKILGVRLIIDDNGNKRGIAFVDVESQ